MNDQNRFVNLKASRSEAQLEVMKEIQRTGDCPFCVENLAKYHKNPILKEGKYWVITDNQWPYKKVKHQVLAIHKEHIEHLGDLSSEAGCELMEFFAEEARERNMSGGGVAIRFGSSEHGNYGSSVLHIHAHLIEPDLEALEETEPWKFKFGEPKNYKKSPK